MLSSVAWLGLQRREGSWFSLDGKSADSYKWVVITIIIVIIIVIFKQLAGPPVLSWLPLCLPSRWQPLVKEQNFLIERYSNNISRCSKNILSYSNFFKVFQKYVQVFQKYFKVFQSWMWPWSDVTLHCLWSSRLTQDVNDDDDDDDDISKLQQKASLWIYLYMRALSIQTDPYQALMVFTRKLTKKNCRKWKWKTTYWSSTIKNPVFLHSN